MKVADLMATDLAVVNQDDSIRGAAIAIADAHVPGVPLVDRIGQLVGVLSWSDIVQAAAERAGREADEPLDDTPVRDIMTTSPKTIGRDDEARVAARQMLQLDVHRLFSSCRRRIVRCDLAERHRARRGGRQALMPSAELPMEHDHPLRA